MCSFWVPPEALASRPWIQSIRGGHRINATRPFGEAFPTRLHPPTWPVDPGLRLQRAGDPHARLRRPTAFGHARASHRLRRLGLNYVAQEPQVGAIGLAQSPGVEG